MSREIYTQGSCVGVMEADEGDGNIMRKNGRKLEVVMWDSVSLAVQVKLLFLLDTGDVTSLDINYSDDLDRSAPAEARDAFLSVLQDKQLSFARVTEVLRNRTKHLQEYPLITLPAGTLAADVSVRKNDEDLLTFVHACRLLNVKYHHLDDKVKMVQEKLGLTQDEMKGNELIFTENLRMVRLCDALTTHQVGQLLMLIIKDEALVKCVAAGLEEPHAMLEYTEGLKEALFFYLIREMELHNKLNRIYTYRLEALLERMQQAKGVSEAEKRVLSMAITDLNDYPSGGRPAGHCMVFCVTKDRAGAEEEIKKVKHVFENSLGYTVHIEKDPVKDKLTECLEELQKPKYKFYDSIVYWFMSHGTETTLKLADGSLLSRNTFIQDFSKVNNFRKKPKIFFMAACQGNTAIHLEKRKGVLVSTDGSEEGKSHFSVLPEGCHNITAVYYQMDRLVASATLPQQYAFRLPDGGSVYVDTVCRLMEKHRGHSITQVLERATNRLHQILFLSNKFVGEVKQACYYESTLQKTFRLPREYEGGRQRQPTLQDEDEATTISTTMTKHTTYGSTHRR